MTAACIETKQLQKKQPPQKTAGTQILKKKKKR